MEASGKTFRTSGERTQAVYGKEIWILQQYLSLCSKKLQWLCLEILVDSVSGGHVVVNVDKLQQYFEMHATLHKYRPLSSYHSNPELFYSRVSTITFILLQPDFFSEESFSFLIFLSFKAEFLSPK